MIPTRRHLEYASGFIALGMLTEAAAELAAITGVDHDSPEVLNVRADFHLQAKQWAELITTARDYARLSADTDKGWIYWAYALRELGRIDEAQTVLLEAEPRHGAQCAVLHYNLACYACLLGNQADAARRLAIAFKMDATWKESALEDADLAEMRTAIRQMK